MPGCPIQRPEAGFISPASPSFEDTCSGRISSSGERVGMRRRLNPIRARVGFLWTRPGTCRLLLSMERVKGIEPSSQAWEARILPLDHTRTQHSLKH